MEAGKLLEKKKEEQEESQLPFLGVLGAEEIGNPLEKMDALGRRRFLDSVFLKARKLGAEEGRAGKAAYLVRMRDLLLGKQAASQHAYGNHPAKQPAFAGKEAQKSLPSFSVPTSEFRRERDLLALALFDFARGDEKKLSEAMKEFESRLASENYKSQDLMATLLLVIEDLAWGEKGGAFGASSPAHFGMKLEVPPQISQAAKEAAIVRLASAREMLRLYFERNPKEYVPALAAALGITSDQEEDLQLISERLAAEIAHIGSFALAQKILTEIKRRKKLDSDKSRCMLELGYHYDKKKKTIVLGKRTCCSASEMKGIFGLILAAVGKKAD